jgi:tetratricopeptide (TPR) repeat protein
MLSAEDNVGSAARFVQELQANRQRAARRIAWFNAVAALFATLWLVFALVGVWRANSQAAAAELSRIDADLKLAQANDALEQGRLRLQEQAALTAQGNAQLETLKLKIKDAEATLTSLGKEVQNALTLNNATQSAAGESIKAIVEEGATAKGYQLWKAGFAKYNVNQLNAAEALYRQAVAEAPAYAPPYNSLGRLRYEKGDIDEAETWFKKALDLRPDYAPALHNLSVVAWKRGNFAEACRWNHAALASRSDYDLARDLERTMQAAGHACPPSQVGQR